MTPTPAPSSDNALAAHDPGSQRVPGLVLGQPAQCESAARQHGGTDQVPGGEIHVSDIPIVVEYALEAPECLGCI